MKSLQTPNIPADFFFSDIKLEKWVECVYKVLLFIYLVLTIYFFLPLLHLEPPAVTSGCTGVHPDITTTRREV